MSKVILSRKGLRCSYCDQAISSKDSPINYDRFVFCDRECLLSDVLSKSKDVELSE